MSDDKYALVDIIGHVFYNSHQDPSGHTADAILAAGFRRVGTVTTEAELEALPTRSVIRGNDAYGNVAQRLDPFEEDGVNWSMDGDLLYTHEAILRRLGGSATVLFHPTGNGEN